MKTFKITVALLIAAVTVISCLCGCAADGGDTSADVISAESAESVGGGESSESTPVPSGSESEVVDNETENMPIISCGKYSGSLSGDFSVTYERGKVHFELMKGLLPVDMNEYLTRDDALYAVFFDVAIGDCEKYEKEEIEKFKSELQQKKNAYVEKLLSGILNKYGIECFSAAVNGFLICCAKEKISIASIAESLASALKDNMSCSEFVAEIVDYSGYDEFCKSFAELIVYFEFEIRKCIESNDKLSEYSDWSKTLRAELRTAYDEYEEKLRDLRRSLREAAVASMNEYLESLNIQFYEKNVYCKSSLDGELSPFKLEFSDGVYSIAFLTREQIKSLKAGEGYALIIRLACEELATMDNEPVIISDSFYLLND